MKDFKTIWLVCRYKDNTGYFITQRKAREAMIKLLQRVGEVPDSSVLKQFDDYNDAYKYMRNLQRTDNDIDNIIKKK